MALVVADPGRIHRRSALVRALSVGLVAILAIAAGGVTARLVVDLIRGGPETSSPGQLLGVGAVVWAYLQQDARRAGYKPVWARTRPDLTARTSASWSRSF